MRARGLPVCAALALVASAAAADPAKPGVPPPLSPLARDGWSFGLDASFGPLPGLSGDRFGFALAGRFGYRFDTGRVFLTPEGTLAFVEMAGTSPVGEPQPGTPPRVEGYHLEVAWIGAGLRAGARFWRLEPSLYAHGYIWYAGGAAPNVSGVTGGGVPAVDLGFALDFRITRTFTAGLHAAYVIGAIPGDFNFGILGLHADLMP